MWAREISDLSADFPVRIWYYAAIGIRLWFLNPIIRFFTCSAWAIRLVGVVLLFFHSTLRCAIGKLLLATLPRWMPRTGWNTSRDISNKFTVPTLRLRKWECCNTLATFLTWTRHPLSLGAFKLFARFIEPLDCHLKCVTVSLDELAKLFDLLLSQVCIIKGLPMQEETLCIWNTAAGKGPKDLKPNANKTFATTNWWASSLDCFEEGLFWILATEFSGLSRNSFKVVNASRMGPDSPSSFASLTWPTTSSGRFTINLCICPSTSSKFLDQRRWAFNPCLVVAMQVKGTSQGITVSHPEKRISFEFLTREGVLQGTSWKKPWPCQRPWQALEPCQPQQMPENHQIFTTPQIEFRRLTLAKTATKKEQCFWIGQRQTNNHWSKPSTNWATSVRRDRKAAMRATSFWASLWRGMGCLARKFKQIPNMSNFLVHHWLNLAKPSKGFPTLVRHHLHAWAQHGAWAWTQLSSNLQNHFRARTSKCKSVVEASQWKQD